MHKHATSVFAAAAVAAPLLLYAFSSGPPPRRTGAPGDGLCTGCHIGTANSGAGEVTVAFPAGMTYTPGVPQEWTVTVTGGRVYGFQLTARVASDEARSQAGDFQALNAAAKVICEDGSAKGTAGCPASAPLQFVEQASAGPQNTFTFRWTPPASAVGDVRVYVAGNAANGNGTNSGDQIHTVSYTLSPAASGVPSISTDRGVVNAASFAPGIAAGSWIAIFGSNLASATRTWRNDEIRDGALPQELDGVRVTVNNRPAAVYFISPGQINVQAPADDSVGPVQVQVMTAAGSATGTAQLQRFAPAFFLFDPEGRRYVAAVHPDGALVGKAGLFAGTATRAAKRGDVVLLFGTGFGPTDPAVAPGRVFNGAARLTEPVSVRIGGIEAEVQFAGLSGAGLYQFNVRIPAAAAAGDLPVVAEIGGVRTQENAFVTVER